MKLTIRIKHWFDLNPQFIPTPVEAIAVFMLLANAVGAAYMYQAKETVVAAQDALVQNERILSCLNKKEALGSVKEYGETWDVTCQIILKKRTRT